MNVAANQVPASGTDDRKSARRRMLKGGKILTGVQHAIVECVVRDMSETGARLRLGDLSFTPAEFLLYIPVDQACYRVRVRRRQGADIGVEIIERVEKPGWCRI